MTSQQNLLSSINVRTIEAALRQAVPERQFPAVTDRPAWRAIGAKLPAAIKADIRHRANQALNTPIPVLTLSLFMELVETGDRREHQPWIDIREDLGHLVMAACLDGPEAYLKRIIDLVWAACEESTWARPWHQREITDVERPCIDLFAAHTAHSLAELDHVFGDLLPALVRKRIRDEVERRCLRPYMARHDWQWMFARPDGHVNNWNAVCNSGVVSAAIYLVDDEQRLAQMIARAARSLDDFMATFGPDGASEEGPGYWNYGVSHFTALAQLLEWRTEDRIRWLDHPALHDIALFPLRSMTSAGIWPAFSDCHPQVTMSGSHLFYLAKRLRLPELGNLASLQPAMEGSRERWVHYGLRSLLWRPASTPPAMVKLPTSTYFMDRGWMIARNDPSSADTMVLATKGGNNGESHNQNDLGNVIVQLNQEAVVADLGMGRYSTAYWSGGGTRYEQFPASSKGHSVPVPRGTMQAAGAEHLATVTATKDSQKRTGITYDLTSAYPKEAGLTSLERQVTLERGPLPCVVIQDRFAFADDEHPFDTALITRGQATIKNSYVELRGKRAALRVTIPAGVTVRIEEHEDIDLPEGLVSARRVVFSLTQPAAKGEITLRLKPCATIQG